MGEGLYIATIIILFILITGTFLLVFKNQKKKRMISIINELEKEKNLLINVPVLNEFSKVEALVKNNKLEEKYNTWKLKFEVIEEETIPEVNDMLIEADFMVEKSR